MATIFRAPLLPPGRPPSADATHTRQFVSAGLALLTAVSLPVGKQSLNPPAAELDAIHARSWTPPNALLPKLEVLLPRGKPAGWELAKQKITDSPLARDRQRVNDLSRQLSVSLPVGDICGMLRNLPQRTDSPRARETPPLNIAAINTVVVVQGPFSQADWPLIEPIRLVPPSWSSAPSLSLTAKPFVTLGWAIPPRLDPRPARDWQRPNDLPRQLEVALPEQVEDWPLPLGIDSPLARDRQRVNDLARQLEVRLPYKATEWPLPYNTTPVAPAPTPMTESLALTAETPFAQDSWPLPTVATRSAFDGGFDNLLPVHTTPVPPAVSASSGARRLVMSLRQAWSRERFCAEVEKGYALIWASVDTTGLEDAPSKVCAALNETIIQMIAKLPQIVQALAAGYKLTDIRAIVAAMAQPAPNKPAPQAPVLDDIEERREAFTSEAGQIERDSRKVQGAYDKARAEQDRLAKLVTTAQAGIKAAQVEGVEQSAQVAAAKQAKIERLRAHQAANQKAVRAALEDLGQMRLEAEAAKAEAERAIQARIEAKKRLLEIETKFRRAMAAEARRKMAEAQRVLADAEAALDLLTGDDDDEAVILLGG